VNELIRLALLHVEVIGPHVTAGKYDLVAPNGEIILPQVWETMVEPGWTVTIHLWRLPDEPKGPSDGRRIANRPQSNGRRRAAREGGPTPVPGRRGPPFPPPPGWIGPPPRPRDATSFDEIMAAHNNMTKKPKRKKAGQDACRVM
jgi:hypothetical protein